MANVTATAPTAVVSQPIYSTIAQFPIVCFSLTLLTDIIYWRTSNLMWQEFSSWLLLAGILFGVLAVVVGVIEALIGKIGSSFSIPPAWLEPVGGVVVLGLASLNILVHSGDGWTAVIPWGLLLSALTVAAIVIIYVVGHTWRGRTIARSDPT